MLWKRGTTYVDAETESESSDVSVENDEDATAQECVDETSDDEEPGPSANSPAPSRTSRRSRTAQPAQYDWQEISAGKE